MRLKSTGPEHPSLPNPPKPRGHYILVRCPDARSQPPNPRRMAPRAPEMISRTRRIAALPEARDGPPARAGNAIARTNSRIPPPMARSQRGPARVVTVNVEQKVGGKHNRFVDSGGI